MLHHSQRASIIFLIGLLLLSASGIADNHRFTVRDSIEMVRFSHADPEADPEVKFSPGNRYFAIVTSHGIIHSDKVESTIWIFDTGAVRRFLSGNTHVRPPKPRIAVRMAAVLPSVEYGGPYEPVISAVQWLPNSKGIYFLEGGIGRRRLCLVDFTFHAFHVLTPTNEDVTQYTTTTNLIIYEARSSHQIETRGKRLNEDAVDITGVPLFSTLFPQIEQSNDNLYGNLWVLHNPAVRKITLNKSFQQLRLMNSYDVLALAPSKRVVIVLLPVFRIPSSWTYFHAVDPRKEIQYDYLSVIGERFRPMEYASVNLMSGKVIPLIRAPNAWALGYTQNYNEATWSPSGRRVLLTNTFLPLNSVAKTEQEKRRYPCFAAVVTIVSLTANCIAFDSEPYTFLAKEYFLRPQLREAIFGKNDDEVTLLLFEHNTYVIKCYRNVGTNWKLLSSTTGSSNVGFIGRLSLAVRQNLNTPPLLCITDSTTKRSKELWNPNPQLNKFNLGKVSLFQWKDVSGHQWVAGLIKPPDFVSGKRYPLVIQTHGFDPNEFMSDGAFTTAFAARPLASAGIIVLQMSENNDHYMSAQEAPDQIRGYESAISSLSAAGLIDATRIGIIGFSRTGYYVEDALTKDPGLFSAAVIADSTHMDYMQYMIFGEDIPAIRQLYEQIYSASPFGKGLNVWTEEAPGFHLDSVRTPLLLTAIGPYSILGEWEIYASLRLQHKPVDLLYIPNGQHILQRPLDRLASQQSSVDWFRFWLQGYEDPDLAKIAQYKRWEGLRKLQ